MTRKRVSLLTLLGLAVVAVMVCCYLALPSIAARWLTITRRDNLRGAYSQLDTELAHPLQSLTGAGNIYDATRPTARCEALYPPGVERRAAICLVSTMAQKQFDSSALQAQQAWVSTTINLLKQNNWVITSGALPLTYDNALANLLDYKSSDNSVSTDYTFTKQIQGFDCGFQIGAAKSDTAVPPTRPYFSLAALDCQQIWQL